MSQKPNLISISCTHCEQIHKYRAKQLAVYFNKKFTVPCKSCGKRFPVTVNSALLNSGQSQAGSETSKANQNPSFTQISTGSSSNTIVVSASKYEGKTPYIQIDENESCQSQVYRLKNGVNIIGRGPTVDEGKNKINIQCTDLKMSRQHCKLMVEGDTQQGFRVFISDIGSLNSTYINEQAIENNDEIALLVKDTVRIGKTSFKIIFK
ncbi:MAG: FHA domain-containing protein [Chitinophagaceae bacterium]|nr:MAG: FHA domain-containing protein [Chitinophagaceae bacterium]